VHRISAAGGASTEVTKLDIAKNETTHRWATFRPDGRHFFYLAGTHVAGSRSQANAIYIGDLEGDPPELFLQARSNVEYAEGRVLYVRDNVLVTQAFDTGKQIAFAQLNKGIFDIYTKQSSGEGAEQLVASSAIHKFATDWAPDGTTLLLTTFDPKASLGQDIFTVSMTGENTNQPFLSTQFNERGAVISKDGRWLLYASNESGRDQIYVAPYPGPGGKWQVSTEGAGGAEWGAGDREIIYQTADGAMIWSRRFAPRAGRSACATHSRSAVRDAIEPFDSTGSPSAPPPSILRRDSIITPNTTCSPTPEAPEP
jgi:hypothetical protein